MQINVHTTCPACRGQQLVYTVEAIRAADAASTPEVEVVPERSPCSACAGLGLVPTAIRPAAAGVAL